MYQVTNHTHIPIFQHKLIVISGTSRREFFTTRNLDLNAGFKVLSGAVCLGLHSQ